MVIKRLTLVALVAGTVLGSAEATLKDRVRNAYGWVAAKAQPARTFIANKAQSARTFIANKTKAAGSTTVRHAKNVTVDAQNHKAKTVATYATAGAITGALVGPAGMTAGAVLASIAAGLVIGGEKCASWICSKCHKAPAAVPAAVAMPDHGEHIYFTEDGDEIPAHLVELVRADEARFHAEQARLAAEARPAAEPHRIILDDDNSDDDAAARPARRRPAARPTPYELRPRR